MRQVSFFLLLLLFSCEKQETEEEVIRPVRYEIATPSPNIEVRTFAGVAKSGLESKLSFKVAGTVEKRPVNVGDRVEKGTLVAQIAPLDYSLQVQEAEAGVLRAEAQRKNAKANYERIKELYETESASLAELDAARAESESTTASQRAAEKKFSLAKAQLGYTTLRAPFSGSISRIEAEVNENVSIGQPIATLHAGDRLEVQIPIPETFIARIRQGESVTVFFDAQPSIPYHGTVSEVGIASGAATIFPLTVRLEQETPGVRSGMAAEVRFAFPTESPTNNLTVPPSAVQEENGEAFVYIVRPIDEPFGVVEKRAVGVGALSNEGLEITEGLQEGDKVVISGIPFLYDKRKVRVQ